MTSGQLVPVPEGALEVTVRGAGDPVLLIQTAVVADELLPLAERLLHAGDAKVILFHRRGYGRSTPARGPGSITTDALDCQALLAALDVERAHVVGASYAGAVALQLASTVPDRVRSLCVIEPPPVDVPSAPAFRAAAEAMQTDYRRHGPAIALERFMVSIVGHSWRQDLEQQLPGAVSQVEEDAATFFVSDVPALLTWRFGAAEAERIIQPVLHIGGTESGAWFAEMRQRLLDLLPRADAVVVDGADHNLVLTHVDAVAASVTAFLCQHPIGA